MTSIEILKDKIKTCRCTNTGWKIIERELVEQGMSEQFCSEYINFLRNHAGVFSADCANKMFDKWVELAKRDYSLREYFPECYL